MKKRFVSLFLVFVLMLGALSFTSCHGTAVYPEFEMPEGLDPSRTYNVTFWAKNESYPTQIAAYDETVKNFEALYPNIKINLRPYTNYNDIYNDVITNIRTKTTPNVCITYPDHIATYITGVNSVVPLDSLMDDEKYGLGGSELRYDGPEKDEIIDKFLDECDIGGKIYALPFMRSTEACYVNKDYVEALGFTLPKTLTWDFVFEVSLAATAKNEDGTYKVNGQRVMIPFIYKSTDNMMISYLKQKGAEYSNENGEIFLFNETAEGLLLTVADAKKNGSFDTFDNVGYPANFLNAGQCIFAVDSTAGSMWMGSDAPELDIAEDELVRFETAVMPIPQVDPEDPKMISQGPSICVFNKDDPTEVLASWLFAQYLLTNDVQIAYSKTEGYCPVTTKAQSAPEYIDYLSRAGEDNSTYYDVKIKATRLLLENTENTFVTPVFNGSTSLRNASGAMIDVVVKAVERNQTVDEEYLQTLYKNMKSLYKLNTNRVQGERELGPLPPFAVWLIVGISAVWVGIIAYVAVGRLRQKRKIKNSENVDKP